MSEICYYVCSAELFTSPLKLELTDERHTKVTVYPKHFQTNLTMPDRSPGIKVREHIFQKFSTLCNKHIKCDDLHINNQSTDDWFEIQLLNNDLYIATFYVTTLRIRNTTFDI